jgi:hypothetical protein
MWSKKINSPKLMKKLFQSNNNSETCEQKSTKTNASSSSLAGTSTILEVTGARNVQQLSTSWEYVR